MLQHTEEAFPDRLTHNIVLVSLSSLILVLLSQLSKHLRLDLLVASLLECDVVQDRFGVEAV